MLPHSKLKLVTILNQKHLGLSECLGIYYWEWTGSKHITQKLTGNLVPSIFLAVTLVAWVHNSQLLLQVCWTWTLIPLTLPYSQLMICFDWVTFLTWVSCAFPLPPVLCVPWLSMLWTPC